ncbi:MAG: Uma2 family endonuclease [Rhizobiales bacterium]|nr:Uma2 family endonuclease [Hyphomicrobiales bacterium]
MSQARAISRTATYQDIVDLPDHVTGEIVAGNLYAHPRPRPRHVQVTTELASDLVNPFGRGRGGPGGWLVLVEPELHLADDIVVPDLAGWRRERMPRLPETAWFETSTDWVCEVLSPSTAQLDRGPKRAVYAREGVKHLWLLDPDGRTLKVFELRAGLYVLLTVVVGDDMAAAPPFDAVPFSLANLWIE